jgi:NAD(P)-dependent dehydrogenase (short-subunit alcohol dehydrogenase family)
VLGRNERVDILVNAAGVFARGDAVDVSLAEWEALLRTNVTGTFLLCPRFGRPMIERSRGKIINFSSTDGFLGVPEQLAYNVSKGAIVQLTRTLGAEWIRHGVNVNSVAPCDFATPMVAPFLDQQEYRDWIMDAIPAGRVGQPHEIVGAVLYLASGASDMVAGHNLLVDGGRTVI